MAAPKWKTPKGNLGTIQEQEYYELALEAIVPDDTSPSLKYVIIAGNLPPGVVLDEATGTLNGRAKDLYRFKGVPYNVSQDVTSTFCCRVTNLRTNQVADRTFSLTVTGQDAPTIVSNVEELGQVLDGSFAEYQITAIDLDAEELTYYITSGELPPGMSLDKHTGIISGLIEPAGFLTIDSRVGWSSEAGWDEYPWEFNSRTVSKKYIFDVNVTDGKDTVSKKFSVYVLSKDSLTADNSNINLNGYFDIVTADLDEKRIPIITNTVTDLGVFSHDNYFAYQFNAVDFDLDQTSFSILTAGNIGYDNETNGFDSTLFDVGTLELPPYLTLSSETGWLYGNIKSMAGIQKEYTFGIFAYKRNYPDYKSPIRTFKMTIVGDLRYYINWISPTDLGTVIAGNPSDIAVEAVTTFNKDLRYSLKVGTKSRLPQGLKLLDNGLIVGRPSFEVTSYDKNTTTFDKTIRVIKELLPETTFDREYTFTVKATDINDTVTAYKTFKVKVISKYNRPYESLYLRAQPGLDDKEIYNQVVFNTDIIPNEYVYRLGDPFYGRQSNLEVMVLSGINPSEAREYIEAMVINHYRKKLLIGEPQIARALDADGNTKYEVLYLPMRDDNGTAAKSINLIQKIKRHITLDRTNINPNMDLTYFTLDGYDKIVYPNALRSMRSQIRDTLGYVDREVLPTWMTSKQEDGRIPYWTPAMVLAYLKPGTGKKVKFLLDRLFEYDLKDISFEVDRYVWDSNLSAVYNPIANQYYDSHMTTFDTGVNLAPEPLVFSFIGNGTSVSFDLSNPESDFDADAYDDAAVVYTISVATNISNIEYTVSGVDFDALAEVTFTDINDDSVVVNDLTNGVYNVDLTTLADGIITASIIVRDTSNNSATGTGDTLFADTTAGPGTIDIIPVTTSDKANIAYVITDVSSDATARITFSDSADTEIIVNDVVNGSYTIDLSTFVDGVVTASIFLTDTLGNTANGTGDTVLFDTNTICTDCSMITSTPVPTFMSYDSDAQFTDNGTYADLNSTCFDWDAREGHQFIYTDDNRLLCITIDADTYAEKRRATSIDMVNYIDRSDYTYQAYNIEAVVKLPGTDWVMMSFYEYPTIYDAYFGFSHPNSFLTFNTVTGAVNTFFPASYPVTNTITGQTSAVTSGIHTSKMAWARPLGTGSGKTLACSQISDDGWTQDLQRAGYGLFIVDNTTGAIDCIAYGDFGERKSWAQAYNESSSGMSVPTEIGANYTEFVYYISKEYTNVDDAHWSDNAWVTANGIAGTGRRYFYKVRVTTTGVITYSELCQIEQISSVGPTDTISRTSYYLTNFYWADIFYSSVDNSLVFLAPNLHIYTVSGSLVGSSGNSVTNSPESAYRGVYAFKIDLADGTYTTNHLPENFSWQGIFYQSNRPENYKLKHNLTGGKINGWLIDLAPSAEWYLIKPTRVEEVWSLDLETLEVTKWIDNPGVVGSYGFSVTDSKSAMFWDSPNCQLFFADWNTDNYATLNYSEWEVVKFIDGCSHAVVMCQTTPTTSFLDFAINYTAFRSSPTGIATDATIIPSSYRTGYCAGMVYNPTTHVMTVITRILYNSDGHDVGVTVATWDLTTNNASLIAATDYDTITGGRVYANINTMVSKVGPTPGGSGVTGAATIKWMDLTTRTVQTISTTTFSDEQVWMGFELNGSKWSLSSGLFNSSGFTYQSVPDKFRMINLDTAAMTVYDSELRSLDPGFGLAIDDVNFSMDYGQEIGSSRKLYCAVGDNLYETTIDSAGVIDTGSYTLLKTFAHSPNTRGAIVEIVWDDTDNTLIITYSNPTYAGFVFVQKYNPTTDTVVWNSPMGEHDSYYNRTYNMDRSGDYVMFATYMNTAYRVNRATGEVQSVTVPWTGTDGSSWNGAWRWYVWPQLYFNSQGFFSNLLFDNYITSNFTDWSSMSLQKAIPDDILDNAYVSGYEFFEFETYDYWSCYDWKNSKVYQFVYSNDNYLWCITVDLMTKAEIRRVKSNVTVSSLIAAATGSAQVGNTHGMAHCPGTDLVCISMVATDNDFSSPIITYNTVSGVITDFYDPATYPVSNTVSGYTATESLGLNGCRIIWASQLGNHRGCTLVCARIDNITHPVQRAGYALFKVINATGEISCLGFGDFGALSSSILASYDTTLGSCIPTKIEQNYTEFVYNVSNRSTNVPEAHWGDEAWILANEVINPTYRLTTTVYKVRVTDDGTITYSTLTTIVGATTTQPTAPAPHDGYALKTGPAMQEGSLVYIADEDTVALVTNKRQFGVTSTDAQIVLYGSAEDPWDSYRGTIVYKINLTTGATVSTTLATNFMWPRQTDYMTYNNPAEPVMIGYTVTVVGNPNVWADVIATPNNKIWTLNLHTLAQAEWIADPVATLPGYVGRLSNNFDYYGGALEYTRIDAINCTLILPDWNYASYPGTPYGKWQIVKFGVKDMSDITADVGNDASVSFAMDIITDLSSVDYVVAGVDADALATITFHDENAHSVVVTGLSDGTYTVNISSFDFTTISADIVVHDANGNTATGTGDTAISGNPRYAIIDMINPGGEDFDILIRAETAANDPLSNWVGQDSASYGNTDGQDLYVGAIKVGRWAGNGTVAHEKLYIDMFAMNDAGLTLNDDRWFKCLGKLTTPAIGKYLDVTINKYIEGEIDPVTLEPTVNGILYDSTTSVMFGVLSMYFQDSNLVSGMGGYVNMFASEISLGMTTTQLYGNSRT